MLNFALNFSKATWEGGRGAWRQTEEGRRGEGPWGQRWEGERAVPETQSAPSWLLICCSVAKSCLTLPPRGLQRSRLPCPSVSWSLLKFTSVESVMPSNHLLLCCPLLLLPSIFPSIGVFSNEFTVCIRWQKSTGASASVLSMNIQSWFYVLAVFLLWCLILLYWTMPNCLTQ